MDVKLSEKVDPSHQKIVFLNSQIKLIGSLQEVNDSRQKEKEDKYAENNHRITEYEKEKDEKEEHVKELELEVFDTKPYHEMLEDLRQKKSLRGPGSG